MALLDMVRRISSLQKDQFTEIRRTAELMHKLGQPSNPAVQIVAATEQLNVTAPRSPGPGRFRRPQ